MSKNDNERRCEGNDARDSQVRDPKNTRISVDRYRGRFISFYITENPVTFCNSGFTAAATLAIG